MSLKTASIVGLLGLFLIHVSVQRYDHFDILATTGNLQHIVSNVDPKIQQIAAAEAVRRVLAKRHQDFEVHVDLSLSPSTYQDIFWIRYDDASGKIIITGTTGVSVLYGLNNYLKYHCNCHVSWEGSQLATLPDTLPRVDYRKVIIDRFRYYQNVCTDSYSFVWWGWRRWEQEIDLMALNGINMPLAFTGQEAIWQRVYSRLGLSNEDLTQYISGPGFLAWWRMGNIKKWGGPVPQSFINGKLFLLHRILGRMRSLGMLPVLPSFAGNVPQSIKKIYPNITLIKHPSWNKFNSSYETFMLDPRDPLFQEIGKRFVTELTQEVGTNHIYNCDTFNENDPEESSLEFLRDSAKSTYNSMKSADAKAVWMIQSWVFRSKFWQREQVAAYLSGVRKGDALILDLEAERTPLYKKFNGFFGHSFVWCMLQNFGGTMDIFGAFDLVNLGIESLRNNSMYDDQFVGIGSCPEGINQNYVMFDFLHEMSLHETSQDMTQWVINYSRRRYGVVNNFTENAWQILKSGVYNASRKYINHGQAILVRRPGLKMKEKKWYDPQDIRKVVHNFADAVSLSSNLNLTYDYSLRNQPLFRHDFVDFTRQFLQDLGASVYHSIVKSYRLKNPASFENNGTLLLEIIDDLEILLSTSKSFLLGYWVHSAESWAKDLQEKPLLRFNALNQITLWGPSGEIVDYAVKQWGGMYSGYYKPRWNYFLAKLNSSLRSKVPFNSSLYQSELLKNVEIPFTLTQQDFPILPKGDPVQEAIKIQRRWAKVHKDYCKGKRDHYKNKNKYTSER